MLLKGRKGVGDPHPAMPCHAMPLGIVIYSLEFHPSSLFPSLFTFVWVGWVLDEIEIESERACTFSCLDTYMCDVEGAIA